MIRAALALVWVQLLQMARSRPALFALLGWPVALTAVLSFALGPAFNGQLITSVRVALVNLDTGSTGDVVAQFLRDRSGFTVTAASSQDEALADVAKGSADVAVIIPADTTEQISHGGKASVEVDAPPSKSTMQSVVAGVIQGLGTVLPVLSDVAGKGTAPRGLAEVSFVSQYSGGTALTASTYYAIGMTTLFMLTQAMNRAEAMVRDRRSDRWQRLCAAPLPALWRTVAWFVASYVLLFAQAVALWVASTLLFGAKLGTPGLTLALLAGYAFALTGLAVAVGYGINNPETVDGLSMVGANILAALGGSFYPLYNFPHWLQVLGRILPNGLMLQTWVQTALSPDPSALRLPLCVFAAMGVVCVLLSLGQRAARRNAV